MSEVLDKTQTLESLRKDVNDLSTKADKTYGEFKTMFEKSVLLDMNNHKDVRKADELKCHLFSSLEWTEWIAGTTTDCDHIKHCLDSSSKYEEKFDKQVKKCNRVLNKVT